MPVRSKNKMESYRTFFIKSIGILQKQEQSKSDNEYLTDFINAIIEYLALQKINKINLCFANINKKFTYRHPRLRNLDKLRRDIIKKLGKHHIYLYSLIDKTKLPYNGCKATKIRRKKQKRVTKYRTIIVSSTKN